MSIKKVFALGSAAVLMATGVTVMASCGGNEGNEKEAATVMNVSCNPSVEFVLDKDNKVISVNALNEEGNLVVSAEAFTGKSADEAAKLFVEVSKETGFIVSGNVTAAGATNEIQISISGDAAVAETIYNDVKTTVEGYLSKENITASIEKAAAITEEQLKALVAECSPYLETAEIQAMEYAELVNTIAESRKETAEYYSQELKKAYYEAKAFVMEQTELETLKSKVNGLTSSVLDGLYTTYAEAVTNIEEIRVEYLVSEDSSYQKALKEFRTAKIEFLNYRNEVASMENVSEVQLSILNGYEVVLNAKESALLSAGELANSMLDTQKAMVDSAYKAVVGVIEQASIKVNDHLTEIDAKQKEAKTKFFNDFETNYASAVAAAEANWANMKMELEKGYQEKQ